MQRPVSAAGGQKPLFRLIEVSRRHLKRALQLLPVLREQHLGAAQQRVRLERAPLKSRRIRQRGQRAWRADQHFRGQVAQARRPVRGWIGQVEIVDTVGGLIEPVVVFQQQRGIQVQQLRRSQKLAEDGAQPLVPFGLRGDENARLPGGAGGQSKAVPRARRDARFQFRAGQRAGLVQRQSQRIELREVLRHLRFVRDRRGGNDTGRFARKPGTKIGAGDGEFATHAGRGQSTAGNATGSAAPRAAASESRATVAT